MTSKASSLHRGSADLGRSAKFSLVGDTNSRSSFGREHQPPRQEDVLDSVATSITATQLGHSFEGTARSCAITIVRSCSRRSHCGKCRRWLDPASDR